MSALRFCMVTTFYPPYSFGGDAIFVHRLANALSRRGHQVDVIHCVDSYRALTNRPTLSQYPNETGVTVHGLISGVGILSPLATHQTGHPLFKGRKIRRILASKPFDVIHFHNVSLVGGPMILGYGTGVKLYTIHEHWLVCPTHVLFKFKREACVSPSCLRCTFVYRRPPQLWRYTPMLARALRHVDAFIAPSDFTRRRHLEHGLTIPIVHIPGFVDSGGEPPETIVGASLRLPVRPYFLFVGRLEKLKGLHTVIPLFHKYRDTDLVIAGEGNFADELRRLAAGCERVHFMGHLSGPALRVAYKTALAVLVPSITFETFGQVIAEAHALRTPVIVRDLGPLPEIVAQTGGGLVFRDSASLLEAMERLRTEPGLRERLGEAGYRAYRSTWTEDAHMQRYFALIEDIRETKRGGPVTGGLPRSRTLALDGRGTGATLVGEQ